MKQHEAGIASHANNKLFQGLFWLIAMNGKLKMIEEVEIPKQKLKFVMSGGSYCAE